MHASIACLLLYEDYVWVSLGNAMKAKQSKAKQGRGWSAIRVLSDFHRPHEDVKENGRQWTSLPRPPEQRKCVTKSTTGKPKSH
jgi:hypothetical protein